MILRPGSRTVRRFTFSDLSLAYKVRGIMRKSLAQFDANGNGLFEENEIKQAMIQILHEDENEVRYVVKNVFRYDRDNDKCVTYDQFTNFSVEQHFGEMAIQRLHRKGHYSMGAQRKMNMEEFIGTLNNCLSPIRAEGTRSQYEQLFREVDLDRDGIISYEEYFIFLREYFGSQSEAYEKPDEKIPEPQPVEPDFVDGNGQSPQQRFAKLIYSQFKISVMERDRNKNLLLEQNEAEDILSNVLQMSYTEIHQIQDKIMNFNNTSRYEDFMINAVVYYLTEADPKKKGLSPDLNIDQFIRTVHRATHFVHVKPADHVLRACFDDVAHGRATISKNQYLTMIRNIFQNYQFDNRGLPRIPSQPNYIASQPNYMSSTNYTQSYRQ